MYGFSVSCFAILSDAMKYADPPCVVFCHIANRNALPIIMSGVSICHGLKLGGNIIEIQYTLNTLSI